MFLQGLCGLDGLIAESDTLYPGQKYTFTYEHGRWFEWESEARVLSGLRRELLDDVSVLSVTRPLFSSRYSVVFTPKVRAKMTYFLDAFNSAWKRLGYGSVTFIQGDTDIKSTAPGGLSQVAVETGGIVSQGVLSVVGPLVPYLIILGVLVVATQVVKVQIQR